MYEYISTVVRFKTYVSMYIFLITDTCFRLISPHRCDVEYHIDRKILSAMGDSNQALMDERPVFYHYTNNSPADMLLIDSKDNWIKSDALWHKFALCSCEGFGLL